MSTAAPHPDTLLREALALGRDNDEAARIAHMLLQRRQLERPDVQAAIIRAAMRGRRQRER